MVSEVQVILSTIPLLSALNCLLVDGIAADVFVVVVVRVSSGDQKWALGMPTLLKQHLVSNAWAAHLFNSPSKLRLHHTYPVQFGVLLLSSYQQLVASSEELSLRY